MVESHGSIMRQPKKTMINPTNIEKPPANPENTILDIKYFFGEINIAMFLANPVFSSSKNDIPYDKEAITGANIGSIVFPFIVLYIKRLRNPISL